MTDNESRRAQRRRQKIAAKRRRVMFVGGGCVLVMAVVVGVVLALRDDGESSAPTPTLVLGDYSISGSLAVEAGDVEFEVANLGGITHNVGVRDGPITADIPPGGRAPLELRGLARGTYELFCDIGDHAERGMVATLAAVAPSST